MRKYHTKLEANLKYLLIILAMLSAPTMAQNKEEKLAICGLMVKYATDAHIARHRGVTLEEALRNTRSESLKTILIAVYQLDMLKDESLILRQRELLAESARFGCQTWASKN